MEPVFKARGLLILGALLVAFFVKAWVGGGFFPWLLTYALVTTVGDLIMTRRYGMGVNSLIHDRGAETLNQSQSYGAGQMKNLLNQAIDDQVQPERPLTFQERFGITAADMNAHFDRVCSLRLWALGIASVHALAAWLVHLDYATLFVNVYFIVRIGCFLYFVSLRALRNPVSS